MDITLVVVRPFGQHAIGDRITAPEVVTTTLASDHAHAVVAVTASSTTPTLEH
jgi:hypothetical protein